ncbi:bifunctional adenosylcobinamide kinase/adenosylcobinamide-phosphate guanylyltransferase [Buttiauxella sp. B2]|uniref:bifunctional adenosylcobinamide kinase/adenosylcobinamide-phosphate guanylyltransferase n=1 Tax=Buttiauxella sp. B2 TaxID=2587812 RepID=UPI001121ABD3|nr:bifunctional adenosylcobinamide kinase/adenosylcobinamide-phosphate guanylyltransferase [Buttiauxella sp. B2]TNV19045.1 bifunctional adenosylcobinamide kinase/adenosylcobinamide-phosphate guanylyltransferase [Buttiauxella sp. B2]
MKLVTGGARSGKSCHAERLAANFDRVLYIATSKIFDDEMATRVQHHRDSRPSHWRTVEQYRELNTVINEQNDAQGAVLLECITTLITNVMYDVAGRLPEDDWDFVEIEQGVNQQIDILLAACAASPSEVILVTNEVGMGIVPENRLARHFRDIAGRVNQRLAQSADEVWLVVSGIGVKIK